MLSESEEFSCSLVMNKTPENKNPNLDFFYEYTVSVFEGVNDSINILNTKMGAVIAFNGLLIRIISDMPDQRTYFHKLPCYTCLGMKGLSYFVLILSIWICVIGLLPKPRGEIAKPMHLLSECYNSSIEDNKVFVLKGFQNSLNIYEEIRDQKSKMLKKAYILLAIATTLFAIDSFFGFFLWNIRLD